jgi:hypothetical protein
LEQRTKQAKDYPGGSVQILNLKEQIKDKSNKRIFPSEDPNYGQYYKYPSRPRDESNEWVRKERGKQEGGLDDSMTESTAKLVDRLVMEEKHMPQIDRTYNDLYALISRQEKELETISRSFRQKESEESSHRDEHKQTLSLLQKIYERVSSDSTKVTS